MAVGKNILANISGRIWAMISIYVFVPIYIHLLGVESYGVISFYTLLLTLLAFADAGLTATLNREFAKANVTNISYKQNLLRTFEYVYFIIGLFIVALIYFCAPYIVENFVKSEKIPFEELVKHIRIMGVIIAFYMASSLYNGGLMGLQKQVVCNVLSIIYGIVRSALVIIPLVWIKDLSFYFYWQLVASFLYFFALRYYIYKSIPTLQPIQASFSYFKSVWKYALGMMTMAVIYSVNTQIDKLSISNLLSLKYFTYYSLAAMIGQGVLVLATPIGIAFFPELTRLITLNEKQESKHFYHKFAYMIAAITSAIAMIVVLYVNDYIFIWTQDKLIAQTISSTTILLTLGGLFMSIQLCPYYLALANGHTKTNVILGVSSIIIIIPSLQILIPRYGLLGAAIPWLVINFVVTSILGFVVMNRFMKGEFKKWLMWDSLLPISITIVVAIPIYFLSIFLPNGIYTILYGAVIVTAATSVNAYIFSQRFPEILNIPIVAKFINKKG